MQSGSLAADCHWKAIPFRPSTQGNQCNGIGDRSSLHHTEEILRGFPPSRKRRYNSDIGPILMFSTAEYLFETSSTLKPTQWSYPGNSVNQIPESATICGDIRFETACLTYLANRLTPFYNMHDCMKKVESYVAEINQNVTALPCRGPSSKYELQNEGRKGEVTLTWLGEPLPVR